MSVKKIAFLAALSAVLFISCSPDPYSSGRTASYTVRADNRTTFSVEARVGSAEAVAAPSSISAAVSAETELPYGATVVRLPVYIKGEDGVYLKRTDADIRDGERVSVVVALDVFTEEYTFTTEAF